MPLALEPRTGEFTPYLKFNGKAGRWYTKNETGDEIEVQNMTAIFDLAQIKTGWILFTEGMAPETTWDNGAIPPQPSPKHKRGFSVNVFSPKELGGVREFSATSNSAIIAIKELHAQFEAAPEAGKGLVPVVKCEGVTPVKSKFGTNYQPILTITKWVPRPETLPSNGNSAGHSETVPPPVTSQPSTTARSPEPNSEEEF